MKLYTINATPERGELSGKKNSELVRHYPQAVAGILAEYGIDGFTIYKVMGYWQGEAEVSFKIEIAVDSEIDSYGWNTGDKKIKDIADRLKDMYYQDSVMITLPNNEVLFV